VSVTITTQLLTTSLQLTNKQTRVLCLHVSESTLFNAFIIIVILFNAALLGAYDPLNGDAIQNRVSVHLEVDMGFRSNTTQVLFGAEFAFLAVYVIEMIIKMIALSLRGYFRVGWNVFDFLIVVVSGRYLLLVCLLCFSFMTSSSLPVLAVIPQIGSNISGVRALRALRPMRLLTFIRSVRVQLRGLKRAFPYLGKFTR
jgi:hypothetical protein